MVTSVLMGVLGAAVVAVSGSALRRLRDRRRGTIRATGTVSHLHKVMSGVPGAGVGYRPVIEFTTSDGRMVQFQARFTANGTFIFLVGRHYRPGHQVPIRYRLANPQHALLDTLIATWLFPSLALVTGVAILAAAVATAAGG